MKALTKKIAAVAMAAAIASSMTVAASAHSTISSSNLITNENSEELTFNGIESSYFISNISQIDAYSQWNDGTLQFKSELYNFSYEHIADLYNVVNKKNQIVGYVIRDINGYVPEFAPCESLYQDYLDEDFSGILFYSEINAAIECGEGKVLNLTKNTEESISNCLNYNYLPKIETFDSQTKSPRETVNVISGVPFIQQTGSMLCIPVAVSCMLKQWDRTYSNLVVTSDTQLVSTITSKMTSAGSATANSSISDALNAYCSLQGYKSHYSYEWNPSFSTIKKEIDNKRVCLLGFASGSSYGGGHMTLCVGVVTNTTGGVNYVMVHDGRSSYVSHAWNSTYNDYVGKFTVT